MGARTVSAAGVVPASRMSALCPEMSPPRGAVSAVVTPLTRSTGMSSLCGLRAIQALACGLMSPTSLTSTVAATPLTSARPSVVSPSTRPG